jgi:RNA polymerase sigma-70 factor (ECF subfamily)
MREFEELYRRYAPDVLRFALYLTGDRAEAEDIASETFVRVFTAVDRIRLPTVKGYLFTIARNLHRQGWRSRARQSRLDADLTDDAPGPEALAEGRAELHEVLAALQQLPEVDRAAVLMRAQDGMSYEEIAAALGLTVAAAKVKVHRARVRLAARPGSGERR